jgi:hypothetical protein
MDSARVMTLNEWADFLRVHPSTIYRLLKRGVFDVNYFCR